MSKISDEFEKPNATPHDAAFKSAFQKRDLARSFFRRYFPEPVIGNENARRMAMTIAERIRQKGIMEGRTEGRVEGHVEGRIEGLREGNMEGKMILIQKQLNKRFGRISPTLKKKLNNSGIELLDDFGESILEFKDMKDAEKWWEKEN